MGSISDFAEDAWLDHALNQVSYTSAATLYLALYTSDPTDADVGSEVPDSGNYARAVIAFSAAASRAVVQSGAVTFNTASGSWGTVTHWGIVTSGTWGGGDLLAHGAFAAGKSIVSGNTPSIATTSLNVTVSAGYMSTYLANGFLDRMFRNQAWSTTDTYVGLATADLNDTTDGDTVTEPSGNGYAREIVQEYGGGGVEWTQPTGTSPTTVDNNGDLDIGPASGGNWGTITAAFVATALTSGQILFYDNGVTEQAVDDGDTAQFASGALDISIA